MRTRFTPQLVELCFAAAHCSFWRKKTLRRFLEQCGVPGAFLATWHVDESKRDFLERLFDQLPKSDGGRVTILGLAKSLADQKDFPDLKGWEESDRMTRDAHEAVRALRQYLDAQDAEIASEKENDEARNRFFEHQQMIAKSQQTLKKLRDRLDELCKQLGSQQAGYDLQDWFYDFADYFEIQNRRPYWNAGRQIDGSLTVAGTTYLVELKFTSGQSDAPDVDVFRRKVDTKADNTMGIHISISGYSSVAITTASGPKTTLLLLDFNHLYLVLSGALTLPEIIERSRRHASQTGEAYIEASKIMA